MYTVLDLGRIDTSMGKRTIFKNKVSIPRIRWFINSQMPVGHFVWNGLDI